MPGIILRQQTSMDVAVRTRKNIEDSDGTMIFVPCLPLRSPGNDGTRLTMNYANALNKPIFVVNLSAINDSLVDDVILWQRNNNVFTLNIAGSRESNSLGIYDQTLQLFSKIIATMLQRQ